MIHHVPLLIARAGNGGEVGLLMLGFVIFVCIPGIIGWAIETIGEWLDTDSSAANWTNIFLCRPTASQRRAIAALEKMKAATKR